MIIEYIEHLRTRPLPERRRFAFLVAAGLTLVIAALWAFTLPARVGSLSLNLERFEEGAQDVGLEAAVAEGEDELQRFIETQETWRGAVPQQGGEQLPEELGMSTATAIEITDSVSLRATTTKYAPRAIIIATSSSATP